MENDKNQTCEMERETCEKLRKRANCIWGPQIINSLGLQSAFWIGGNSFGRRLGNWENVRIVLGSLNHKFPLVYDQ